MELPRWLEVGWRAAPSANVALVRGTEPLLVDAAEGQEPAVARTAAWLAGLGVDPAGLRGVACTHWHPDHVGGVAWLAREHGATVLGHEAEAALLAADDPSACDAIWLAQPVADFLVHESLADGDVLEVPGGPALQVVHTPGQTPGHIALWEPEDRVLLTGDLLQRDDVAWLPLGGRWAGGALGAAVASVERLAGLGARLVVPGHGPLVEDVPAVVERTLARYASWGEDRSRWAWHGARRLCAAQVALRGPQPAEAVREHLALVPALAAMAAALGMAPEAVADRALADLRGSGALADEGGVLAPRFPHEPAGPWRHPPAWGA